MYNLIDTIKLRFDINSEEKLNSISKWLKDNYSDSYEEITKSNNLKTFRCEIRNLKIFLNPKYLFVTGSINKFYAGNNIEQIPTAEIVKAFNLIQECLGNFVDVKKAYVRQLDIGINIVMNNSPQAYISRIHTSSNNIASSYGNETLNTGNKSRGMKIYDKTKEAKLKLGRNKSDTHIPENLLRLEATVKGRRVFEKHFGHRLPTVENILQKLDILPDIWLDEYKRLDKEYDSCIDFVTNKQELFYYAITEAGFEKCAGIIEYSYSLSKMTKQDRYRLYNSVKTAFTQNIENSEGNLMTELDEKINNCYFNLKNS